MLKLPLQGGELGTLEKDYLRNNFSIVQPIFIRNIPTNLALQVDEHANKNVKLFNLGEQLENFHKILHPSSNFSTVQPISTSKLTDRFNSSRENLETS
jgi:hypothetical protein